MAVRAPQQHGLDGKGEHGATRRSAHFGCCQAFEPPFPRVEVGNDGVETVTSLSAQSGVPDGLAGQVDAAAGRRETIDRRPNVRHLLGDPDALTPEHRTRQLALEHLGAS